MTILAALAALALALIHFFGYRLKFLHGIPRSQWLSLAGGASVAYVFMHILPELEVMQNEFENSRLSIPLIENHIYIIALIGMVIFYGLERAAKLSAASKRSTDKSDPVRTKQVFWIHIASFALYNIIIGYLLLHRLDDGHLSFLFFAVAMAFHFLVNDYGLYDHYQKNYIHNARWILSVSVIAGFLTGIFIDIPPLAIAIIFAFIAGGVILNVLKEELPEHRKSRYWAFLSGALIYSILLLVAW